ncbi:unnamed protein product [Cuscuta epithymum]|uniref:Retrotransposon Copia-like N-terminal domain-containing protein n=1 Tax=Cuscuta epithymum TaxID=186058 RepID=A0AAV0G1Y7_9ASTE|nr:unnamed protein product [Cuscuta epithymum]CAH9141950.1 unnamed protein product [Cuscuta epithymum]
MADTSSPYYLGSGDQPGNVITHVIFKGDNYVAWSRAITLSLKARRKYVFVDGTETKPTDRAKLLDWDTVNSMVVSWLLRSMEPNVAASIPFHDEARALWVYLEKRFSVANGLRLQQLRASITGCKQSKAMSVDAYYTALMSLYDEFNRLKPLHACTCGRCTCNVAGKFAADREEERLHQFLIGIDDEVYGTVRSNLLSQTPVPDIDRAHQAFLQEENSRAVARGKQSAAIDVQAFALTKGRQERVDKSKLMCTHCKQKGHEVGACFKLHGYPEWWDERNRNKGAAAGRGGGARAHAASPLPGSSSGSNGSSGSRVSSQGDASALHDLSREQVQALLNLISVESSSSDRMSGPTLEEPDWSR